MVQDRVVGVLDVESDRISYFTEDHSRTLSTMATQIASSVENARLYEELAQRQQRIDQDLQAARKLQRVLMPREARDVKGLEIGIRSRPAREISGDVFDFFEQSQDYALIAFGDVSGKGAAAALYGALVSGLLRILGPRRLPPGRLVKVLNELLLERKVEAQYATLLLAQWEPQSGRLRMASAGSEPPLVFRRGEIIQPKVEGVPIGLLEDREYDEVELLLEPGDTLLFYSDGVEDQLNAKEEDFSRARVAPLLRKHAEEGPDQSSPQAIADAFFAELDQFRGETPITDDQTVVVARVLP
jgi:sigma-B regulation protein RsbU (phosphoserine phosphatase)